MPQYLEYLLLKPITTNTKIHHGATRRSAVPDIARNLWELEVATSIVSTIRDSGQALALQPARNIFRLSDIE